MDPFAGIRQEGRIYGRGTQDMKCVCIQYIEALRKLHAVHPGYRPTRSIYLTFVPDEEIGGADGMAKLLVSPEFAEMNVGVALDEGLANEGDAYTVFYGERTRPKSPVRPAKQSASVVSWPCAPSLSENASSWSLSATHSTIRPDAPRPCSGQSRLLATRAPFRPQRIRASTEALRRW